MIVHPSSDDWDALLLSLQRCSCCSPQTVQTPFSLESRPRGQFRSLLGRTLPLLCPRSGSLSTSARYTARFSSMVSVPPVSTRAFSHESSSPSAATSCDSSVVSHSPRPEVGGSSSLKGEGEEQGSVLAPARKSVRSLLAPGRYPFAVSFEVSHSALNPATPTTLPPFITVDAPVLTALTSSEEGFLVDRELWRPPSTQPCHPNP